MTLNLTPEDQQQADADALIADVIHKPDPEPARNRSWRPPPAPEAMPEPPPEVTEAQVRLWLEMIGRAGNFTLPGRGYDLPNAWLMNRDDLDAMAPHATAIINRTHALRAAAARSDVDALALGLGFARYAGRNIGEIMEARAEAEPPPTPMADRARPPAPPLTPVPDLPPGAGGPIPGGPQR